MEKLEFKVKNKNGTEKICEVIATYHDDKTKNDFLIYTDKTFDKNQKLNIFSSLYKEEKNGIRLIDITSNDDKKLALQIIQEILSDIK